MRVAVLVLVTIRLAVAELQAAQAEVAASGKFGILRPPLLGAGGLNPVQTCIGAFCQQNNQNHGGQGGGGFGGGGNTFHPRPPFSGGAGSGGGLQPSQTCLGGQCQQNNDNLGLGPGHGGGAFNPTQTCVGGACQQNNQHGGFSPFFPLGREN